MFVCIYFLGGIHLNLFLYHLDAKVWVVCK